MVNLTLPSFLKLPTIVKKLETDFAGDPAFKNLPANAGDTGLIPGQGRFHIPWGNYAHAPRMLSLCPRAPTPQ